jgi:hypothetical protein
MSDLGQLFGRQTVGKPNQRRPQSPVDKGDLSIDELADEYLVGIGDGPEDFEDLMAQGVSPPTTFDELSDDGLGESGY